jgi:7 transmembrane sweet-taste receptor of 3 GCPR
VKDGATSWNNIPNTTLIYRDGTTTPSRLLRRAENMNTITPSVRVIGLVLMSILIFVALATAALLFWLYNDPIVQSAQPIFMLLLCAGSVIMSTTIFTLSFDEAAGWTNQQLSVACSLAPWLFFTGQLIIVSAHFAKLYRLDQVIRWRLVTRSSALWPWLLFVIVTISILMAQTVYDPWSWVRVTIREIPFETYGECSSNHDLIFFVMLIGLIFVNDLLTLVFAWKMADIPGDFLFYPDSG